MNSLRSPNLRTLLGCFAGSLLALACSEEDPTIVNPDGNGGQTANNGGSGDTGGDGGDSGSGGGGNASNGGSSQGGSSQGGTGGTGGDEFDPDNISGDITEDMTWTADQVYTLTGLTFVTNDAVLTIEAGTKIVGDSRDTPAALIVTRGSRVEAVGTAQDPIVFTSVAAEGTRLPGQWGGVALLGAAPTNVANPLLEGIEALEGKGAYGGDDAAHDCGTLEYVRIEFAGYLLSADNELNGLTVAGCGTDTSLDYIQVHRGSDDGVEFFGGTANLKHAVLSNNQDDSLDWDFGWVGHGQFLVVRHDADNADTGFEADNGNPSTEATPRSAPTIYNATLVGSEASTSPGMNLRRGTWGIIRNSIITGFPVSGIDIRDAFSVDGTETDPLGLTIENSIFFANGEGGTEHGETEPLDGTAGDDDGSFDEAAFLANAARNNQMSVDPQLPDAANATAPNLVPPEGSPAATGAATPAPAGFDAANYIGAFEPGGTDWTTGWTSYPEN